MSKPVHVAAPAGMVEILHELGVRVRTQTEYTLEIQRDGRWLTYTRAFDLEQLAMRARNKDNMRPKGEPGLAALPTRTVRVTIIRTCEVMAPDGTWTAL